MIASATARQGRRCSQLSGSVHLVNIIRFVALLRTTSPHFAPIRPTSPLSAAQLQQPANNCQFANLIATLIGSIVTRLCGNLTGKLQTPLSSSLAENF